MNQSSAQFEGREVVVGGRSLFYRRSIGPAPEDRPQVVFVHGLGLSGRYMLPTAASLMGDYQVYLPDLPGFGDSAKPARILDVPGLADALAGWIEAAEVRRAVLLGNSFGCQIIVDLAGRYPNHIDRAVLQGPTAPADERTWLWQAVRWRQNQPFNPRSLGPITWGDYRKCGWRRLFQTFHYSLRDPVEAKLGAVACPALVVRGQLDPICRRPWAEEVVGRLPRGCLTEIPDVAHTLVYTAPVELAAAVRKFLQRGERTPQRTAADDRVAP